MEALQKPVTSFPRAAALHVTSGFYGMCIASGGNPFLPDKLQAKVFNGTLPPPLQCAGACGSDPKKRPGRCRGQPYAVVEEEGTQYLSSTILPSRHLYRVHWLLKWQNTKDQARQLSETVLMGTDIG